MGLVLRFIWRNGIQFALRGVTLVFHGRRN
jgi:hypothetical protein